MNFSVLHHFYCHIVNTTPSGIVHGCVPIHQRHPTRGGAGDIREDEHNIPLKLVDGRDLPFPNSGPDSLDRHRSFDDFFIPRRVILNVSIDLKEDGEHTGLTGFANILPCL